MHVRHEEAAAFAASAEALPHAISARVPHPGRQVVSISGEGGLSMVLSETLTVSMYDQPDSGVNVPEAACLVRGAVAPAPRRVYPTT